MKIVFCTTVKGRTAHLAETLPRNLLDNADYRDCKFLILDYCDGGELETYLAAHHLRDLQSEKVVVYQHHGKDRFYMAHAKNMAARLGILEGAEILVTLDADNFAGKGFATRANEVFSGAPNVFMCPEFIKGNPARLARGFAGRLAIRSSDFTKAGGYDEKFDTWRGEDIDLIARLTRMGFQRRFINNSHLGAVRHGPGIRFKEYPEARQFENGDVYALTQTSDTTIVNYGKFGCGTVYRNFDSSPTTLLPMPTRIFGVGLQRTATSSLHRAFQMLGFDSAHWKGGAWAQSIWQEMNKWGRSHVLEKDYALSDNPIPLVYQQLDKAYPNSKFILTVRDEQKWLASMEKFWAYETNKRRWTWDNDGFSHKMHGMLYGTATFVREAFLATYRSHNAQVKEYFKARPHDLLVMDMEKGAGWPELCGFLMLAIPPVPYPKVNVT